MLCQHRASGLVVRRGLESSSFAVAGAPPPQPHRRRAALRCCAAVKQPLTGPCVVKLTSKHDTSCSVTPSSDKSANLQDYMAQAAENFANIQLPMGGKITRVDGSHVELVIPRLSVFDVWLQPRAVAALSTFPGRIEFISNTEDCSLEGSHHVKDFRLDERFNLDVRITFQWRDDCGNTSGTDSSADDAALPDKSTIFANGSIMIEVDIPPPFSFMPRAVLTAAGNTALAGSMQIIMSAFVSSLARDYSLWANDPTVRKKRQQLAAPAS